MPIYEIQPDITLFGKLGARSRALPMVVTELVDNSLDSWIVLPDRFKKKKHLRIEINVGEGANSWFTLKDNAGGMDPQELAHALTVARSDKESDKRLLGRFGFGLKSATMYIGRKFQIYSCPYSDPKWISYVEFDRDKFEKHGKWLVTVDRISKAKASDDGVYFPDGHGTFIRVRNEKYRSALKPGVINRLRKVFAPRLPVPSEIRKLFSKRYSQEDEMILLFNNEELLASGPFYTVWEDPRKVKREISEDESEESSGEDKDASRGAQAEPAIDPRYIAKVVDIPSITIGGKRVYGRAGIIDRGMQHNSRFGFDLIKNGRIIELHAKDSDKENKKENLSIGLLSTVHNARIVGQLFLDEWQTDHQKTEFIKDSEEWHRLGKHVREHIKPLIGLSYSIQNPDNKGKADSIEQKKASEYLPTLRSNIQNAARSGEVKNTLEKLEKKSRERVDNDAGEKKGKTKKRPSNTSLLYTIPDLAYSHAGKTAPVCSSKTRVEGRSHILRITLNLDHPFLKSRESGELKTVGQFLAVDAFAEYLFQQKGFTDHGDFLRLRESLLLKFKRQ